MKIEITIRLLKAILGARRNQSCRVLDTVLKNGEIMWEVNQTQWRWVLSEALAALPFSNETSVDYIRLPIYIKCPNVQLYERKFRDKTGERQTELFESFPGGSRITVPVFVLGSLDADSASGGGLRPPTTEEVLAIFEEAGENIGISPWGSKFGYGRFNIAHTNDDASKS